MLCSSVHLLLHIFSETEQLYFADWVYFLTSVNLVGAGARKRRFKL